MSELTPRYGIVGLVIHWPRAGRPDASVRAGEARYRREEAAEIEAEAYHAALLSSGGETDFLAATFVFEDAPGGRRLVSLRTSPNPDPFERRCRVCGCTDDHACEGGCWWVAEDLCSACAGVTDDGPEIAAPATAADLTAEEEADVLAAVAEVDAKIKRERVQDHACHTCGRRMDQSVSGMLWWTDGLHYYCHQHCAAEPLADPLTPAEEARLRDEELLDGIDEAPEHSALPETVAADPGDDLGAVGAVAAELLSTLALATVPDGEMR